MNSNISTLRRLHSLPLRPKVATGLGQQRVLGEDSHFERPQRLRGRGTALIGGSWLMNDDGHSDGYNDGISYNDGMMGNVLNV